MECLIVPEFGKKSGSAGIELHSNNKPFIFEFINCCYLELPYVIIWLHMLFLLFVIIHAINFLITSMLCDALSLSRHWFDTNCLWS